MERWTLDTGPCRVGAGTLQPFAEALASGSYPGLRRLSFRCLRGNRAAFGVLCTVVERVPSATHWKITLGELGVQHRDVLRLVCALRTVCGLYRLSFSTDAAALLHGASISALMRAIPGLRPPAAMWANVSIASGGCRCACCPGSLVPPANVSHCRGLVGPAVRGRWHPTPAPWVSHFRLVLSGSGGHTPPRCASAEAMAWTRWSAMFLGTFRCVAAEVLRGGTAAAVGRNRDGCSVHAARTVWC